MPRWVVVFVLAALAVVPSRAAAADCAAPGVPGQFDVFTAGSMTANTGGATIPGRVAAGGDARVQGITVGTNPPLTPDASRADVVVGRNLTVDGGGGSVPNGRVTYGGALTATGTLTALGGLHQAQPPFDFAAEATTLSERSAQWADLPANGAIGGPGPYDIRFTGTNATRNVFAVTAAALQGYGQITIDVPPGSTTLINVSGASFTSALYRMVLVGATPETVVWNFPLATSVQQASGLEWQGTLLAPHAAASLSNGQLHGQLLAASAVIGSEGLFHHPFSGCLPPQPAQDLSLASLCTDPVTNHHAMRLRNLGDTSHAVSWTDADSAQTGSFTARAATDTFFDVLDGDRVHHIVATSGSTTLKETTTTRPCAGTITVRKRVTGPGVAPPGPWRIHVDGDNGFGTTRDLVDGAQSAVAVPGGYQAGSVPIGQVAGGVRYAISEPDTLGAIASVDSSPVTILDGQSEIVTVGNDFPASPEPPIPPEPPVAPPPQPVLPPGPTGPLPGPDLVLAASRLGGADVAVSETISPRVSAVGDAVSVTVRVRNYGPLPAVGVLAREIPQVNPRRPNQVARIVRVNAVTRAAGCTSERPVSCGGATLPVGAEAVIRVRARMLVAGLFKSVIVATSDTPDPNTTNNLAVNGLVVRRPANIAVGVKAPPVARVGEPVSYRIVARGTGRDGARSVRFCHRPPPLLLMTSAPGTFRYRGRVCRDVSRLARGRRAAFTVNAIPASSAGGRRLALRATATAPDARPAAGSARIVVAAQSFAGSG